MFRFVVLTLFIVIYDRTGLAATIDQRQNGESNVQIDLKNLKIVGLTKGKEEYVDYDYVYDYSEMTIKPPGGTTKKSLNVTVSTPSNIDNSTSAGTTISSEDQTTVSIQNSITTLSIETTTQAITASDSSTVNAPPSTETINNISNLPIYNTNASDLQCKKGFFRNSKGNCELRLQNPSNVLLEMIKKSKLNNSNSSGRR